MKRERWERFLRSAGATALAVLVSMADAGAGAVPDAGPKAWWQVSGPSLQPAAAIGAPAKGCLAGAQALPLPGSGYEVMRPSRRRTFGHPELIAFITTLAAAAPAEGWPGLLVGDLAQARGGPTSSGHRSHQSGLDVDIWLQPVPEAGITATERESLAAASVVTADGTRVDAHRWTAAHQRLIRTAAGFAKVDRIFVNPAIKQALCDGAGNADDGERAWLRKIRPWWGHDAHMHIRLGCPDDGNACEAQPPIPAGDGCGADLAWWFSAEAAEEVAKKAKAPPARALTLADLPPACREVLMSD
jgi:penicillin-insensitive murein endopeptidase